ncbi:dihydrofolate reductase [Halorubrum sp. CBA1125]|uniref:dihydrofolate reductase n=1 Tax=Halorubrum sp. CBA1125 TaxID=2668072 RepID=UPI0012E85CA1|nr:dihydrofolate reductase [Halorubrum sp. CBA1125]MUW14420.1 dihydrofolate reductase [Halorubrum sp. CBA1125]
MAGDAGEANGTAGGSASGPAIVLVAAVAENRVIGADGGMPWHYPADLAHFKRLTTGHPVIVGRTTYESIVAGIGGPLPDRTNVVLTTRDIDDADLSEGAIVANGVEKAIERAAADAADRGVDEVYVVGGAAVYEQFLDRADRMVLTEVPERPDGDTRFPAWDADRWSEVDRKTVGNGDDEDDLAFVTYERVDR